MFTVTCQQILSSLKYIQHHDDDDDDDDADWIVGYII